MAPRSVRRVYQTLAAVLNSTVLDDALARSPCRGIQLPEIEPLERPVLDDALARSPCRGIQLPEIEPLERPVLSPDELLDLAEALGPEYEGMAFLGAVLGLRWGECAGLKVGRIDFERETISVAQQVTRGAGGRSVLGPPKSAAGRRTLAAPTPLVELLKEQLEQRERIADMDAFVFTSSSGEHIDYSNWLHRIWYAARERASLEWLQFHDLRRANATGLVLEGVDIKTAQARLGHTDPRLTLAIYAQATTEADRAAADLLGERFLPRDRRDTGRGLV